MLFTSSRPKLSPGLFVSPRLPLLDEADIS